MFDLRRFWLCNLLRKETKMHWLVFNYSLKILLQVYKPIALISSAVPGVHWRLECSQLCGMFCTVTAVYWQLNVKDPQKIHKHSSLLTVEDVTNLTETSVLFYFTAGFTTHTTAKRRSFRCLSSSHKSKMMQNSYVDCSLNSEIRKLAENQEHITM